MTQIKAKILKIKRYGPDGYVFRYSAPEIANEAQPGQFVLIRCGEGFDPLLRRPFSFHRIDKQNGIIDILFRVVGKGTALLAEKNVGETSDILGPLGKGFEINNKIKKSILIAGGMGVAPILALADQLVAIGIKLVAFLGAKTNDELWCSSEFESLGPPSRRLQRINCETHLATDDGSIGFKGTVLELFKSEIRNPKSEIVIYSCGPEPMLKQLSIITKEKNIQCQISLETNMACGLGACQGCVVPVIGPEKYKLVCKDGPVFNANEIDWNNIGR